MEGQRKMNSITWIIMRSIIYIKLAWAGLFMLMLEYDPSFYWIIKIISIASPMSENVGIDTLIITVGPTIFIGADTRILVFHISQGWHSACRPPTYYDS